MSLMLTIATLLFSGCAGIITGHEYTKSDFVIMHKVLVKGVPLFMSEEEIEKAKLSDLNMFVTDTYKIIEAEGK